MKNNADKKSNEDLTPKISTAKGCLITMLGYWFVDMEFSVL